MKFKMSSNAPARILLPLAPMVNVVFLLLLFFMLNLKIALPDRTFDANLPVNGPGDTTGVNVPDIKVGLRSDGDGNLTQLTLGGIDLGNDNAAFDRLNKEILKIIGRPGNPLMKDIEVEIDADYECQHKYVAKAITQCTGRFDPQTQKVSRYVEKVKFAPQHRPKGT